MMQERTVKTMKFFQEDLEIIIKEWMEQRVSNTLGEPEFHFSIPYTHQDDQPLLIVDQEVIIITTKE
jgi:hypothetical protein